MSIGDKEMCKVNKDKEDKQKDLILPINVVGILSGGLVCNDKYLDSMLDGEEHYDTECTSDNKQITKESLKEFGLKSLSEMYCELQPHQIKLLDELEESINMEKETGRKPMSEERIQKILNSKMMVINIDAIAGINEDNSLGDIVLTSSQESELGLMEPKNRQQDKIDRHSFVHPVDKAMFYVSAKTKPRVTSVKVEKDNPTKQVLSAKEKHIKHMEHIRNMRSNKKNRY